jgi:hypothetical protein
MNKLIFIKKNTKHRISQIIKFIKINNKLNSKILINKKKYIIKPKIL